MDTATLSHIALGLVLGFLLGWLIEWRMDVSFWNSHVAQLNRREALRRVQTEKELERVELEADQQIENLRRRLEAEITELRTRSDEQIAAARARAEAGNSRPKQQPPQTSDDDRSKPR
jgi:hypothetical protein